MHIVQEPLIKPETIRSFIRNYGFERVRAGRSKFKKILQRFLPDVVQIELAKGWKMQLDLRIERQAYIFWHWEEDEAQLLWAINNLLPVGGTMVDCGANVGFFGLYAMYARGAKSHFIEPHPRLVAQMQETLSLNFYGRNGLVHPFAASDRDGRMSLQINSKNDGGHRLVGTGQVGDGFFEVQTKPLRNILLEEPVYRVDFLKIDAEGHDLRVLLGLGDMLNSEQIPVIYIEESNQAVHELLVKHGYRCYQSIRYYIDPLRKKIRSGNLHGFFRQTEKPGINQLWVERNGVYDNFLGAVSHYGTATSNTTETWPPSQPISVNFYE